MKQCITLIALLTLTAPVFAQTVHITLADNGGGLFTIGYSMALLDDVVPIDIAGVSMIVTLSGGDGHLAACGDAVAVAPFSANIDYFNNQLPAAPVLGAGCPVGDVGGPGLPTFPAVSFAISTGVLGTPANAIGGTICTIQLTGTIDTTVTLTADVDRGGIVGVGGIKLIPTFPTATILLCTPFCFPGAVCGGNSGNQQADDFVAFGAPACWCTPYHCDGDADTAEQGLFAFKHRVGTNDLNIIVANWHYKATTPGFSPCADVDHKPQGLFAAKHRVGTNDLNLIVTNWQAKSSELPGNCPRPD